MNNSDIAKFIEEMRAVLEDQCYECEVWPVSDVNPRCQRCTTMLVLIRNLELNEKNAA
jgi:uncharacterized paraquat-inducible protein A